MASRSRGKGAVASTFGGSVSVIATAVETTGAMTIVEMTGAMAAAAADQLSKGAVWLARKERRRQKRRMEMRENGFLG